MNEQTKPARAATGLATLVYAEDHAQGADRASVTLVEYGDFECPLRGQAYPAVKLIQQRFGERLRLVYRHFPLKAHPHAHKAAEAAEAAHAQARFWEMHALLFHNQLHLESMICGITQSNCNWICKGSRRNWSKACTLSKCRQT